MLTAVDILGGFYQ